MEPTIASITVRDNRGQTYPIGPFLRHQRVNDVVEAFRERFESPWPGDDPQTVVHLLRGDDATHLDGDTLLEVIALRDGDELEISYFLDPVILLGPDGQRFRAVGVRGACTVNEIGVEMLSAYVGENWNRRRMVVDVVVIDGSLRRLDPRETLHDAGVRSGDVLEVAPESTAGGPDSDATPMSEVVVSSLAPPSVRRRQWFPLRIVLHSSEVSPSEDDGIALDKGISSLYLADGTALRVVVEPPRGFRIKDTDGLLRWTAPSASIDFLARANLFAGRGEHWFTVRLLTEDEARVELTRFYVRVQLGRTADEPAMAPQASQRLPRRYFASYASADRTEVLSRLSAVEALGFDVFVDCLDLREGAHWECEVQREVVQRDGFLLFWSSAARASQWVEREWRHRLTHCGLDSITPNALERCSPPAELASLQFGSRMLRTRV